MAARRAASLLTLRSLSLVRRLPLSAQITSSAKTLATPPSTTTTSPFQHRRLFCSSSPVGGIAYLKSDQDFANSLAKAKDDGLPAIFYFTAAWCGPCRLLSPVIEDLNIKYPNVNIYKIDVDEKELESTLRDLRISSVPTLHFFHQGKKATEIVGADVALLKKVMEEYYK